MNQLKAIERRKKQKICIYKNKRKKIKKDITFWQRHRYWNKNRIICINWHLRIFVGSTHRRFVPRCTKWLCSCKGPTHSIHFKPGNIKGNQKFAQFIVYFLNNKKNYTANLVDLFQNWNFSVSSSWSLQLQYFNIRIFCLFIIVKLATLIMDFFVCRIFGPGITLNQSADGSSKQSTLSWVKSPKAFKWLVGPQVVEEFQYYLIWIIFTNSAKEGSTIVGTKWS